jgi:hypothetical protein
MFGFYLNRVQVLLMLLVLQGPVLAPVQVEAGRERNNDCAAVCVGVQ